MKTRQFFTALLLTCVTAGFAQVGIGTQTPNSSSMLDVDVTSLTDKKGLLPPRMTQLQRNAIVSPAEGLMVYNIDSKCFEFFEGTKWVCHQDIPKNGSTERRAALSCKVIKENYPASPDGAYWLDIDGTGSAHAPQQAYCDMTTDGGGWTLIGQHNHPTGQIAPAIRNNFPNKGSDDPSVNERTSTEVFGFWGMVNPAMRQAMVFTEYRVESYLTTSGFHFKSTDISFIKNGTNEIASGKTSLSRPSYWPNTAQYYEHCNSVYGNVGVPLQQPTRVTFHHSGPLCHGAGDTFLLSRISSDNGNYTNEGLQPPGHVSVNGLGRLYVR